MTVEMLQCYYEPDVNGVAYSDLEKVGWKKSVVRAVVHSKKKR